MNSLLRWAISILAFYTVAIISLELSEGQTYIRQYVGDIKGDVLLYGINTSLCTVVLALTSYTFFLAYRGIENQQDPESWRRYYLFQTLIFAYLALDERFMLHERIGFVLGFHDSIPLIIVGFAELYLIWKYKQIKGFKDKASRLLLIGGFLFASMLIIDVFGPSKGVLRLSLEDLSKLWAIVFLFFYAFHSYTELLKNRPEPGRLNS